MMRLARIVCVASDLGACVRSLPRPCNSAKASSNASQIVRVLLNSNASAVLTMTRPTCACARADGRSKGSCDEVDCRPVRFATAARSLGGSLGTIIGEQPWREMLAPDKAKVIDLPPILRARIDLYNSRSD